MAKAQYYEGEVFAGESAEFLAHITDWQGNDVKRADIASIAYTIYLADRHTGEQTAVSGHNAVAIDKMAVLFDTLQLGEVWDVDTIGFNFQHQIDISSNQAFLLVGSYYVVQYRLIPVSGQPIPLRFRVKAI